MAGLIIKNGLVVLPDGVKKTDILLEKDVITKIAQGITQKDAKVLDAGGKYVLAGFVDMHCHLRDPGFLYKENVWSGSTAAYRGGFTSICCMPNTDPVIDNAALVEYLRGQISEAKVFPIGAITKGQKGEELAEMKSMNDVGAVAFSDDGKPVESGGLMKLALEYAATFDLLLISHSEDKSISGDGVVNEGYHASVAGLKGISRVAEESMVARDILLAEAVGARVHIAHVSTRGSVELVRRAKKRGVRVTCETCPHYFAATDKEILNYNTNAKINPPLRTEDDRLAIIEGLKDGTIDAIATDHAPHTADEKNREFDLAPFGTVGFETAFAVGYTYLVKPGHITLNRLSELMSANPARIMGLSGRNRDYLLGVGEIKVGYIADLTVVDLDAAYTVDAERFVSNGHNSLFDGWELSGVVTEVVINGSAKGRVRTMKDETEIF